MNTKRHLQESNIKQLSTCVGDYLHAKNIYKNEHINAQEDYIHADLLSINTNLINSSNIKFPTDSSITNSSVGTNLNISNEIVMDCSDVEIRTENISLTKSKTTVNMVDFAVQVDLFSESTIEQTVIVCNRYINVTENNVETQIESTLINMNNSIKSEKRYSQTLNKSTDSDLNSSNSSTLNKIRDEALFYGYSNLKAKQALNDLCDVTTDVFELLLKLIPKHSEEDSRLKITDENRLMMFLMKMKCGMTFNSIGALCGVHPTTASRIFHELLLHLSKACKNYVYWPKKEVIEETMPLVFKNSKDYKDVRVIIDATEFVVEQPATLQDRVYFYSHYKKGYRIKVIVGCSPAGQITFISKCYGGRATDTHATVESGFIQMLEGNDKVLADKGFPKIQSYIDKSDKNIILVMPPFKHEGGFTDEQIQEQYNTSKLRIHIERIMQRIRIYKITEKFTMDLVPFCDEIIFMCGVLVNLQPPIIKVNEIE